jgi:hypothetical protein
MEAMLLARVLRVDDQPIAVVLDLVNPVGARMWLRGQGGNAGLDEAVCAACRRGGEIGRP